MIGTPAKKGQPSLLAQYVNNCDRERLSALARKSLGPVCLCDRGGHHGVLVWYHGDPMGWTRYEQLARHVDVNCTGKTEDPWELPLMTNTTTKNLHKIIQKNKTAYTRKTKIYVVARRKARKLLTRGPDELKKQTNKI